MSEERDFTPEATHLESDEVRALPSSGFGTIPDDDSGPPATVVESDEVRALPSSGLGTIPDDDSGPPATVIESDEVRALPSWPNHASSGDDSGTATLAPPRGRPTEPGSRIGPYEIRAELARGGIGAVYRAYDPELEREVALKVLLSGVRAGDQELLRFRREAKAAARLLHPGIVAVHDVGEDQGLSYMVMDLIEGESLRDKIKREKTLPSRVAAGIGRDLALAVSHAHGHGILHRDLKPANVLLAGEEGRPLITDFGLAKDQRIEEHLTRTGAVLGTPAYMPPEQARGLLDELDARVDVYALGATLYHALAGRPPFDGRTALQVLQQVLREEPPPLSGVDRDLKTICLRCLEKDKDARYASAQALADDLGRYLRHEPIHARPPGPVERLRKWTRRKPGLALAGGVTLLALIGGGTLLRALLPRAERAEANLAAAQADLTHTEGQLASAEDNRLAAQELAAAAARKERAAVANILAEARSGALRKTSEGLESAVFQLVAKPSGASLLIAEVTATSEALAAVPAEGEVPRGVRQKNTLGQGRLDAARVACEALGRLSAPPEASSKTLARYLAAEHDPLRAVPVAVALCRIGGEAALTAVHRARRRFGLASTFDWQIRAALAEVKGDLALEENTPTAHYNRGEARLAQRDFKGAIEDFSVVLRSWPKNVGALCNRAQAKEASGDLPGAGEDFDRAIEIEGADATLRLSRALLRKRLDDVPGARSDLDQALKADPTYVPAWHARATLFRDLREDGKALKDFARALELNPDSVRIWTDRAEVFLRTRRLDLAEQDIQRAFALDPKNAYAWLARGGLLLRRRDVQGADAACRKAIALDPDSFKAWELLGTVRLKGGDTQGAIEAYSEVLKRHTRSTFTFLRRGVLLARLGKHAAAIKDFSAALELEPNQFQCLASRGLARQNLGDHQAALADFRRALEQRPKNAPTLLNQALSLEALGKLKEALRSYDAAFAVQVDPAVLYNRGLVKLKLDDGPGAIADFERSLEIAPRGRFSGVIRRILANLRKRP